MKIVLKSICGVWSVLKLSSKIIHAELSERDRLELELDRWFKALQGEMDSTKNHKYDFRKLETLRGKFEETFNAKREIESRLMERGNSLMNSAVGVLALIISFFSLMVSIFLP